MDIFGIHVVRHGDLHVGEVPEAADAQGYQTVGQRLRHVLGHRQHRHIGVMLGCVFLQLVHGADSDAVDLVADQGGGDVEGGVQVEAHLGKIKVLQQRVAQVAGADDDQLVVVVDAQNMADLRAKLCHIITVALLSELAKAAEILADLRGGDVHLIAQRVGGDADNALVVQVIQIAVVPGETVDHSIGDFLLFHIYHPLGVKKFISYFSAR